MNHERERSILSLEGMKAVDVVVIAVGGEDGVEVSDQNAELVEVVDEGGDGALATAIDEDGLSTEDEVAVRAVAVRIF
jgi:hypothetical protein